MRKATPGPELVLQGGFLSPRQNPSLRERRKRGRSFSPKENVPGTSPNPPDTSRSRLAARSASAPWPEMTRGFSAASPGLHPSHGEASAALRAAEPLAEPGGGPGYLRRSSGAGHWGRQILPAGHSGFFFFLLLFSFFPPPPSPPPAKVKENETKQIPVSEEGANSRCGVSSVEPMSWGLWKGRGTAGCQPWEGLGRTAPRPRLCGVGHGGTRGPTGQPSAVRRRALASPPVSRPLRAPRVAHTVGGRPRSAFPRRSCPGGPAAARGAQGERSGLTAIPAARFGLLRPYGPQRVPLRYSRTPFI